MVRVSFNYEPDEPDDDDSTGMSAEEFDMLVEAVIALGGDDVKVERA